VAADSRHDLDLKIGTTGAERGLPAPEVSTKSSPQLPKKKKNKKQKKYHPINTTTTITFVLRHEGNFEFSYFLNVFFCLPLQAASLFLSVSVSLFVSVCINWLFASLKSKQVGL